MRIRHSYYQVRRLANRHASRQIQKGKIELQPEYQREYVWGRNPELPSRLIESLLLDIPIPPIYFAEMPGGVLEVIDGQQWLTTLVRFVNNKFPLQRLQRMSSLIGKYFKNLPDEQQEKILDAFSLASPTRSKRLG